MSPADDIEELMRTIDGPMALPVGLRASLAAALADGEPDLGGLDAPHELPDDLRSRLAAALVSAPGPTLSPAADVGPGPAPSSSAPSSSAPSSSGPAGGRGHDRWRWLAVAAASVVVVGGSVVALRPGGSGSGRVTAIGPPVTGAARSASPAAGQLPDSPSPTARSSSPPATPAPAAAGPPASGGPSPYGSAGLAAGAATTAISPSGGAAAQGGAAPGPQATLSIGNGDGAPPFGSGVAGSLPTAGAASPAAPVPRSAPPAPPAPIVIDVVGGDASLARGFDAYVSLLNGQGGVAGRQLTTSSTRSAAAVATVNLSDAPVAPGVAGPVLETLAVPESLLTAPVYDLAGAAAHQGALAVDAVFPVPAPGRTAVVYRSATGVYADEVPAAMVAALRAKGVPVTVATYVPGQAFPAARGSAAFLSLDTSEARSWLADADRAGDHPALGIAGTSSLVQPALLPLLPSGTRAVGAYDLPGGAEQAALAAGIGGPPGMAEVHGWVTAKALAVALYRSGATTPAEAAAALAGLVGWSDGFAPPIAFRAGTTSRTPDGRLYTVGAGGFMSTGAFLTDPA